VLNIGHKFHNKEEMFKYVGFKKGEYNIYRANWRVNDDLMIWAGKHAKAKNNNWINSLNEDEKILIQYPPDIEAFEAEEPHKNIIVFMTGKGKQCNPYFFKGVFVLKKHDNINLELVYERTQTSIDLPLDIVRKEKK